MWSIATLDHHISGNIRSEALKYVTEILSCNFTKKMDFVHRSIESIGSNNCLHESLQVLTKNCSFFFKKI